MIDAKGDATDQKMDDADNDVEALTAGDKWGIDKSCAPATRLPSSSSIAILSMTCISELSA